MTVSGHWVAQDLSPGLIFTRIAGYGQTGPKATLPGYASVCEGYGGLRCRPNLPPTLSQDSFPAIYHLHSHFQAS